MSLIKIPARPILGQGVTTPREAASPGAPKANVAVRIGRTIIQIQGKGPGIRSVVPIGAAYEGVIRFVPKLLKK